MFITGSDALPGDRILEFVTICRWHLSQRDASVHPCSLRLLYLFFKNFAAHFWNF